MQKHPPNQGSRYMQGYFRPLHPERYRGNSKQIIFRSGWEAAAFSVLDRSPHVLEWSAEPIAITYQDQSTKDSNGNFALRRYIPDLYVKYKDAHGKIRTVILEIKPDKETKPPLKGKGKRILTEAKTYVRNQCKWSAAVSYCQARGWEFRVVTEKTGLGL